MLDHLPHAPRTNTIPPHHSYNAKLTSTKQPVGAAAAAAAQASVAAAKYGIASPLLNATFTMALPAGVNVMAYRSSPKLAIAPTFNNATGRVTWTLGTVLPGKSVKIALKLQATACSTPNALALNGQFSFSDATGAKMVGACLKKPVRVLCVGRLDGDFCPCTYLPRPTQPPPPPPTTAPAVRVGQGLRRHPQVGVQQARQGRSQVQPVHLQRLPGRSDIEKRVRWGFDALKFLSLNALETPITTPPIQCTKGKNCVCPEQGCTCTAVAAGV